MTKPSPKKKKFVKAEPSPVINLIYIRAAIEANCGVTLGLDEIQRLLVEEGLATEAQIKEHATPFRGYSEYYEFYEDASTEAYKVSSKNEVYDILRQED